MSTVAPVIASGSTNGRNIKVAATATAGTLIHTAHATSIDQLRIYANNTSTTPVKLTIEWGGTTSPDDLVEVTIEGEAGYVLVIPKLRVTGSVVVRAFAGTTNVINVNCTVDRYTP